MTPFSQFKLTNIAVGLPFASQLDSLADALCNGDVVVQAPPGTGKTTLVPPAVANAWHEQYGRVVVTAPRRVAVRSAARRLAQLSGTKLGEEVGFTVRGESRVSRRTRVEFVTPGVLLRRLLRDGDIEADAVIIDEVHERGLDTDLVLAMLRDLRDIREDLRIIAMSATVDAPKFAELLGAGTAGAAPIVAAEAEIFPLDIRYAPFPKRLDSRGVTDEFLRHVAEQAAGLITGSEPNAHGDVLVFLPGVREVDRCAGYVEGLLTATNIEVLTLHGRQSAEEQDRVFRRNAANTAPTSATATATQPRRVIVSTSIAESSVTVPGVRAVVDACLARGPRLDVVRGFSGLVTTSCAQSSANQRAGRAGREGPGIAIRCVSQSEFSSFPAWPAPEIAVADLTQAMLDAAAWGTPRMEGLKLLDAPPAHHTDAALEVLAGLGAIDDTGAITDLGRRLATLPVHPRMGRALLAATELMPEHADKVARAVEKLTDARGLTKITRDHAREHGGKASSINLLPSDIPALVTALAWPDFVGRRRGADTDEFLFTGGTAATGPRGHEWIAASEITRQSNGRALIRASEPIDLEIAMLAAGHLARTETTAFIEAGRVRARERELLGAIELSSRPAQPTPEQCVSANSAWLADGHLTAPADTEGLRRRMAFAHVHRGEPWPDVSSAGLAAAVDVLFAGELDQPRVPSLDSEKLRRLLPWPEATEFDSLVPERMQVPSGSRIRLEYPADPASEDTQIVLAVKLQECFGLAETPQVLGVPVTMHLLSPAGRPLAVTQDLSSFWNGAYSQVRAEMRGRYPKHPWPENPWEEQATARTKRR